MIDPISDQQQQQQSEEKEASAIQNSEVKGAERLDPTAPLERKPSPTLASPSIEHKRLSKVRERERCEDRSELDSNEIEKNNNEF